MPSKLLPKINEKLKTYKKHIETATEAQEQSRANLKKAVKKLHEIDATIREANRKLKEAAEKLEISKREPEKAAEITNAVNKLKGDVKTLQLDKKSTLEQYNEMREEERRFKRSTISSDLANKFNNIVTKELQAFKQGSNNDDKKAALKRILWAIKEVQVWSAPNRLANDKHFLDLKNSLFQFAKEELTKLKVETLHDSEIKTFSPLPSLIEDMSPTKANKLMTMLANGNSHEPINLYQLYEKNDRSKEADDFREFLKNYSVTFLGGGNSKNYKVVNAKTNDAQVLKVDYRGSMPRHIERHLRQTLGDRFLSNYLERQAEGEVYFGNQKRFSSRTILVTDFCTRGSVDTLATSEESQQKPYESAATVFIQMADAFLEIQNADCFFPDSKLSNWLVGDDGKLLLGDSKSFLYAKNNYCDLNISGNEDTQVIYTPGFKEGIFNIPPPPIDVEKTHAAILGKNLYIYLLLTTDPRAWLPYPDGMLEADKHFTNHIFSTEKGQQYKTLILKLTDPNLKNRMSLTDAREALKELEKAPLKTSENLDLQRDSALENKASFLKQENISIISEIEEEDEKEDIKSLLESMTQSNQQTNQANSDSTKDYEMPDEESQKDPLKQKFDLAIKKLTELPTIVEENDSRINDYIAKQKDLYSKVHDLKEKYAIISSINEYITLEENFSSAIKAYKDVATDPKEYLANKTTRWVDTDSLSIKKLIISEIKFDIGDIRLEKAINDLKALAVVGEDPLMQDYINEQKQKFTTSPKDEKEKIIQSIKDLTMKLKDGDQTKILQMINQFRIGSKSWLSIGMKDKAERIEEALRKVPLHERVNIFDSKSSEVSALKEAIASHRHFSSRSPKATPEGNIDEKKAAKSFTNMKKQFDDLRKKLDNQLNDEGNKNTPSSKKPTP